MSASEVLCFCRYICVIVGEKIPINNKHWKLYLILRKLVTVLTRRDISIEWCDKLQYLIEEHHKLFLELYDQDLKPKFHFMLHYPEIIKKTGPPVHLWSMRYEAKHKERKAMANVVSSRVNV